jgi:signal transduction histidine kinase
MATTTSDVPRQPLGPRRGGAPPGRVRADAFVWQPGRATPPDVEAHLRELHHDLRQPLATVRALVYAAQSDPAASELVTTCLARISDEAERMLALCRHVLEGRAEPRLVDLARLAEDVASGCELATGRAVRVEAEPVELLVDAVELRRALLNLLDNAARAAGPDGEVFVRIGAAGGEVRVTVEDSGPGFATGTPGTASLGLAIVSAVAGRLGARVELEESQLGGARVSLVFAA